jgi:hypothetical protein
MKSSRGDGGNQMETRSLDRTLDHPSFAAFLDQVQSRPPDSISQGKGIPDTETWNSLPLSLETEEPEIPDSQEKEDDFLNSEEEAHPVDPVLSKAGRKPPESRKEALSDEQDSPFTASFLINLVHSIKNTLASIHHATLLSVERADDPEIRIHSHAQVKEDIRKIDSVLNSVLNFISINTPIAKENTLYRILEEILEANEKQLWEKNIKIIKRLEKDLPETYIHSEQVRFILHSVLQYAIFSTPRNETIGLLLNALDSHDAADTKKDSWEKRTGYVEVVVGFDGELTGPLENLLKRPENQRQPTDLILILVNDILTKNRGSMTIESNGKRPNTLITLRFPIERRNVVYYEPITL